MADFEPPSFSLGFDLDLDSEPQPAPIPEASTSYNLNKPAKRSSAGVGIRSNDDEDDDFETPTMGLCPQVSEPTRTLKRLRRGLVSEPAQKRESKEKKFNVDDDIEEFSSQDDQPLDNATKHQHSICSSSKFPLNGHGLRTAVASQSRKQLNERKKKDVSNASASLDVEAISNKFVFPDLHVSPLRRFQLIESDSDEPSPREGPNEVVNIVDLPSTDKQSVGQVEAAGKLKKKEAPVTMSQAEDLWKEIHSEKSFRIPTPALDEVCEEYFRSVTDKNEFVNCDKGHYESCNLRNNDMQQIHSVPLPPVHHYYYHDDSRIQKLVRARLPHFLPLSSGNNQGHEQHNACKIDYMSQFNRGETSKQGKNKGSTGPSSTRSQKNSRKSSVQELPEESESWINPRCSARLPKDAGQRRVHAVGKSAGHWYTAADGRRVYVAGNGQELIGQIAYRQYRRESGGFKRKSKKKAAAKKKTAGKKAKKK